MKRTSYQSTSEQHRRLSTDTKIEIELFCSWRLHRKQRCFKEVQCFWLNHYLFYLFLMRKSKKKKHRIESRSIKAYDISNRSTSYRAQLYDQNKLLFDSIASQMTALQVKNRNLKFFALTQIKIGDETRVHQRKRKNHQFRQ